MAPEFFRELRLFDAFGTTQYDCRHDRLFCATFPHWILRLDSAFHATKKTFLEGELVNSCS